MPTIPYDFDGSAFETKYNLTRFDFMVDGDQLVCPSLPNLTDADLLDCVVNAAKYQRVNDRKSAAETNAKNIPSWAVWSEADALAWWNNNLSDAKVDALSVPQAAKDLLKAQNAAIRGLARMVIALRDKTWPELPE